MTYTRFRHGGTDTWEGYRNVYYQTMCARARKMRQPEDVAGFGLERLTERGRTDRGAGMMQLHPDPVKYANVNFPNLVIDYWKNQNAQKGEGAYRGRKVVHFSDDDARALADGSVARGGSLGGHGWLVGPDDTADFAINRADLTALLARIRMLVSPDDLDLIIATKVHGRLNRELATERGVDPSCISKRINAAIRRIRASGIDF